MIARVPVRFHGLVVKSTDQEGDLFSTHGLTVEVDTEALIHRAGACGYDPGVVINLRPLGHAGHDVHNFELRIPLAFFPEVVSALAACLREVGLADPRAAPHGPVQQADPPGDRERPILLENTDHAGPDRTPQPPPAPRGDGADPAVPAA